MAAPKGNQFWKLASTFGRDTIFENPAIMWDEACKYFEWCDKNPFVEQVVAGKDAVIVELNKMRPYTLHGICGFLNVNTEYLRQFKKSKTYVENKDFSSVITRIEEIIFNQKFSGAASGFFNANIISRDLGLMDKTSTDLNVKLGTDYEDDYE